MIVVYSYGEFEVCLAEEVDIPEIERVLFMQLVTASGASRTDRQKRVVQGFVRSSMKLQLMFVLAINGTIVGAASLSDYKKNVIDLINVVPQYRVGTGTGVFMHYILNIAFEDEKVFFYTPTPDFANVATPVCKKYWVVNDNVSESLNRLFRG